MADAKNHGFLVLADISGYTAFVTATELEHGPPIITALLEAVIERISPPLEVHQIQGDAVFALGVDGKVVPPARLLDVLRAGFEGFRARQLELEADDSCTCRACRGRALEARADARVVEVFELAHREGQALLHGQAADRGRERAAYLSHRCDRLGAVGVDLTPEPPRAGTVDARDARVALA